MDVGTILTGDKPVRVEVTADQKAIMIFGIVMFVAITAAYFFIKSVRQ